MHKVRSENDFWYKCPKPNCQSTFQYQCLLDPHMRIHNNELNECQYCPYRYVNPPDYKDHLNKHFRIKFKCDQCEKTYSTRKGLNEHNNLHEGIIYCCLICNTYEIAARKSMKNHLRAKHSDVLGKNISSDSVKRYVKFKSII